MYTSSMIYQPNWNDLLKADKEWKWSEECSECFLHDKKALKSAPVLAHYNPKLPITVTGDASPVGIATVSITGTLMKLRSQLHTLH